MSAGSAFRANHCAPTTSRRHDHYHQMVLNLPLRMQCAAGGGPRIMATWTTRLIPPYSSGGALRPWAPQTSLVGSMSLISNAKVWTPLSPPRSAPATAQPSRIWLLFCGRTGLDARRTELPGSSGLSRAWSEFLRNHPRRSRCSFTARASRPSGGATTRDVAISANDRSMPLSKPEAPERKLWATWDCRGPHSGITTGPEGSSTHEVRGESPLRVETKRRR